MVWLLPCDAFATAAPPMQQQKIMHPQKMQQIRIDTTIMMMRSVAIPSARSEKAFSHSLSLVSHTQLTVELYSLFNLHVVSSFQKEHLIADVPGVSVSACAVAVAAKHASIKRTMCIIEFIVFVWSFEWYLCWGGGVRRGSCRRPSSTQGDTPYTFLMATLP